MLVERWHLETNTFLMPFGEMTKSPDVVSCLLGLPITEKSVCMPEDSDLPFPIKLLVTSLGVSHSEARDELNTEDGGSVCLD